MYDELHSWAPGSAGRLDELSRRFSLLYQELAREELARDPAWLRWRWFPKNHLLLHLAGAQAESMGNPRGWWNFADESAIGMSADIAESVHPWTFSSSAVGKYMVLESAQLT